MNLPSIRTLESAFPGMGHVLRELLESATAVRAHPAAVSLANTCYTPPRLAHMRMTALNAELGFHGVEYVRPGRGSRSPGFEYLNTGHLYAPTIVRFSDGRYRVTDIGSIIERSNYE